MLGYGSALEGSGAAQLIVKNLLLLIEGQSIAFILCSLFIFISLFTNLVTNNAAVIIFIPIAINLAYALNVDVFPFISLKVNGGELPVNLDNIFTSGSILHITSFVWISTWSFFSFKS